MKLARFIGEIRGTAVIEFGITAPFFFLVLMGIIEGGLMLWTQLGLERGVEAAARCASVNTTLCGGNDAIQTYAAQQSYGLNPPPSTFKWTSPGCGNQIKASYRFPVIPMFSAVTLEAQSCFPR